MLPHAQRRSLRASRPPLALACLIGALALPTHAARLYRGGAVASAHPVASAAALEMLDHGGNAVDAAVAAAFAVGVVNPFHNGLGGGGFALIYDAHEKRARFLDFREVAPHAATRDMFLKDGKLVPKLSTDGGLAVAVPGAAAGYFAALKQYGKLSPKVVLGPAIKAARSGFWVSPKFQQTTTVRLECLRADPELAKTFLARGADGTLQVPPIGAVIRQPELAKTLELLAQQGPKAIYDGKLTSAIASSVRERGGILTEEDLRTFNVRWREPLIGSYRGHVVLTAPPPSGGGVSVLQVLGVLQRVRPTGFAFRDVDALHLMIESIRRSYLDRVRFLGDPGVVDVPTAKLLSDEYLSQMASAIDVNHVATSQSLATPGMLDGGVERELSPQKHTTHISVVDRDGNAVALTSTVNSYFGACVMARGTGIVLNDQMDDFATQPLTANVDGLVTGEANAVGPGKIPLSSMTPTIVLQKDSPRVQLVVGSNGGSTIPTTVIQIISSVIDGQMDVPRALALGRIHHQFLPDQLWVERFGLEPATLKALEAKGHVIRRENVWSWAQAVGVDPVTQLRTAASDPRSEGSDMGQD